MNMQKLLESLTGLPQVSRRAAEAYNSRKGLLAESVNLTMAARQDLARLIGSKTNIELMQNNHQNHVQFITTVLHLNAFRLLASVIPWIYLTYHQHGFSFEYFPVALAAWKQAVINEIPKELAQEIVPVYDWMLSQHETAVSELSNLPATGSADLSESAATFLNSILEKDLPGAVNLALQNTRSEDGLRNFYNTTMQPAMYEVGARWSRGEISVADEHMATAVAQSVVANLQAKTAATAGRRGKAIITAATNEQHDLGARMAAHVFETDGWEVVYLGANMPISDLTHLARRVKPRFIGISVAMPYNLHHVKRIEEAFKNDVELKQIKIIVSGIVFRLFPEAATCLDGINVITNLDEAITMTRRWAVG